LLLQGSGFSFIEQYSEILFFFSISFFSISFFLPWDIFSLSPFV